MEEMAANVKVERVEEGSPAATEEAMDVGEAKFEENIWYKKYQLLKRKCSEFEQLNDILFTRAKKIHRMIEKTEAEKRSLMKRLEQFEVVEFPKTRQSSRISLQRRRSPEDDLSELDHTLPFTATRVRAELEATKAAAAASSSSLSTVNSMSPDLRVPPPNNITVSAPPPLLGPFPHESQGGGQPSAATTSLHHPSTSVTLVPASSAIPIAMTTASAAPLSSISGNVGPTQVGGRGKKWTRKDGGTVHKGSSKKRRGDVDPNAPKKPSNAFFWFCQDKRAALQEQVKLEGLGGQHDLTKALARLWSETKTEDKKMYYEKYATDKARYDREMEDYQRSKQNLGVAVVGGRGGGRGQPSATPAPAPAAVSSGLHRVEPLALTTAVQQTVPSLPLQAAGEES